MKRRDIKQPRVKPSMEREDHYKHYWFLSKRSVLRIKWMYCSSQEENNEKGWLFNIGALGSDHGVLYSV